MGKAITIEQDDTLNCRWIRIFIPSEIKGGGTVSIRDRQGVELKRIHILSGNNAIDMSQVPEGPVSIKVETQYETILKIIKPS